ncbi:MAG TPA: hypothetical protein VFI16_07525, partial [Anaeromyxobacteraceae bacterium]|nr:hypothetical protein [Anaeromyxobacteraceae bacterium]
MHPVRALRPAAIAWALAAVAGCGGSSGKPPPPQCTQASDCAALPNAAPACVSGACALGACNAGFADCDASGPNGCEVNTGTSLAHCGACNQACAPANATGACGAGQCLVAACTPPFSD